MTRFDPLLPRAIFSDNAIYLAVFIAICCFFLWIYDELKLPSDFSHLPAIHRPDGARPYKDDWVIYKLGIKIPRWWFTKKAVYPPRILIGSKELRFNHADASKNEDVGLLGNKKQYPWPQYGPKPFQKSGWYLAINFPQIFGLPIPIPYLTVTVNGKAFRIGARWSEGPSERYIELFGLGTKDLNG